MLIFKTTDEAKALRPIPDASSPNLPLNFQLPFEGAKYFSKFPKEAGNFQFEFTTNPLFSAEPVARSETIKHQVRLLNPGAFVGYFTGTKQEITEPHCPRDQCVLPGKP